MAFNAEAGRALDGGYQSAFYGLRPEVVLSLFARQDLWDGYVKSRAAESPARRGR